MMEYPLLFIWKWTGVPQVLKYYSEEAADYENLTDIGLKNKLVLQINNNRARLTIL
jgi:hypothetical protein